MTRKDLKKIKELRVEVIALAEEIAKDSQQHVTDVVMGSRHEMPYDLHTIVVEGIDFYKVIELRENLNKSCRKLQAQLCDLEEWVESIPDSEMRSIIRLYYMQGKTQREIGNQLGYDRSLISKRLHDFMEKIPE